MLIVVNVLIQRELCQANVVNCGGPDVGLFVRGPQMQLVVGFADAKTWFFGACEAEEAMRDDLLEVAEIDAGSRIERQLMRGKVLLVH